MSWSDEIIKSLPLGKIYDDVAEGSTSIIGEHLTNITKTLLAPLSPFAATANYADRFHEYCARIGGKVTQENLHEEASAQIIGPCFDALKYSPANSPLTEMFLNLLASSIDKERTRYAHPAFPLILSHLSHDEACIIYQVSEMPPEQKEQPRTVVAKTSEMPMFCPGFLRHYLFYPDNYYTYAHHLDSLGLVNYTVYEYHHYNNTNLIKYEDSLKLSSFGELFVRACISDNMKEIFEKRSPT